MFWRNENGRIFGETPENTFYLILIGCVITIGIYNFLTPYFTDDYGYAQEARSAGSLWGLIKQQYIEYMYHNARIIGQFNLRLFLIPGKWLFNIVNSLMFTGLVLLIYAMIHGKKKYDLFVLFLVITFVWRYSVRFGETTLWLCGTCNYLWGMVIIMGFLVWYRHMLFRDKPVQHPLGTVIGGFFFGLAAGWCNENTSGGAFLLTLFFTIVVVWIQKNKNSSLLWRHPSLEYLPVLWAWPCVREYVTVLTRQKVRTLQDSLD